MCELKRLNYIERTRGKEAAEEFAIQTLGIYLMALKDKNHHANLPEYRDGFVLSVLEFINYLLGEKNGSIA